ncbi:MAG TPA: sigma-70 family RNA polymerase sigma factor, partial [Myxococcales bacterium]|nr:sigma-70 family RNA polymerase sigma factor [Myxococcales bacterium]
MTLDAAAIERLYRSHGYIVLRRARALLGSEPDAQEALQEVFASLLRAPQVLRSADSVVGWLYRATTHFCLNQLRNRRTGSRLLGDYVAPALAAAARSSAEAL